jgi:hypothetical protein
MRTVILLAITAAAAAEPPRHLKVYEEPGRFGGWPANHGIWSWGNEILVGFSAAWYQSKSPDRHQMDSSRPEEPRLARSLDGGETWTIEAPRSLLPPEQGGLAARQLDEPVDFSRPGFLMTIRFTDIHHGPSYLFYSYDKGKTWRGPFLFPLLGFQGVAARTDYTVMGRRHTRVFLTASKSNGREGRPFCAETRDGGQTWQLVSLIGDEPPGFSIMPSALRLGSAEWLVTVRVKQDMDNWIEQYRSRDDCRSWLSEGRVANTGAHSGNPPHLIRLRDGRLCLTYGHRAKPYAIRAKLSPDEGKTWSEEITLRDDAAAWDLGYPRSVQRADGHVITLYYFNDAPHRERFIAATIWDPGKRP